MTGIKAVIDYCGLDYYRVLKLPIDTFMFMRKQKFIDDCMQTEEGRKYLDDCKRLNQTEPDYNAIEKFKKSHS